MGKLIVGILVLSMVYMAQGLSCGILQWCCGDGTSSSCTKCCDVLSCGTNQYCCDYSSLGDCSECCNINDLDDEAKVAVGLIVGLAIGIPILIIACIVVCCCCIPGCPCNRNRKRENQPQQVIVMGQQNPGYYDGSGQFVPQQQQPYGAGAPPPGNNQGNPPYPQGN